MATAMYVFIQYSTCATAKIESQRTAGNKAPGEGAIAAGRTKLFLCYYCRIQETPGASEDTRGNKEEHQRDRRAHGGSKRHHEDRRAQRSGETPKGPEGTTRGSEQAAKPQGRIQQHSRF
jgi:hypothetical protein